MKKMIALILAAIMLSSLAACGQNTASNENADGETDGGNVTEDTEKEEQDDSESEDRDEDEKPQVASIFLSKTQLELGVNESLTLTATVSPSTADAKLTWSSSDTSVVTVTPGGFVCAKKEGSAVIKVEAENGVLAVCNVEVRAKVGGVTGEVTYKYNDYIGHKADTGATVILVPKETKSLPDGLAWGFTTQAPDGVFCTKVSGSGQYTFDNVPAGDYYLVIISKNTNENYDRVTGIGSWGMVYFMFSDKGQENAISNAKLCKTRTTEITVRDGQTTTYSYNFGITYF